MATNTADTPALTTVDARDWRRQTLIGLGLAAAIIGSWLAVDVCRVFFWPLASVPPIAVALTIALQCWLSVGLFIVAHDAMHGSLAPFRPASTGWSASLSRALCRVRLLAAQSRSIICIIAMPAPRTTPISTRVRRTGSRLVCGVHARVLSACASFSCWRRSCGLSARARRAARQLLMFWAVPALLSSLQLFTFGTYLPHRPGIDAFTIAIARARTTGRRGCRC